ncbi:hypothetical protein THAOC_01537, partial [Thalassiosira oceanica]
DAPSRSRRDHRPALPAERAPPPVGEPARRERRVYRQEEPHGLGTHDEEALDGREGGERGRGERFGEHTGGGGRRGRRSGEFLPLGISTVSFSVEGRWMLNWLFGICDLPSSDLRRLQMPDYAITCMNTFMIGNKNRTADHGGDGLPRGRDRRAHIRRPHPPPAPHGTRGPGLRVESLPIEHSWSRGLHSGKLPHHVLDHNVRGT